MAHLFPFSPSITLPRSFYFPRSGFLGSFFYPLLIAHHSSPSFLAAPVFSLDPRLAINSFSFSPRFLHFMPSPPSIAFPHYLLFPFLSLPSSCLYIHLTPHSREYVCEYVCAVLPNYCKGVCVCVCLRVCVCVCVFNVYTSCVPSLF